MKQIEISREEWEEFLKWKKRKDDRELLELDNETTKGEGNNSNHQGSNNRENNTGNKNEAETVTLELKPNKPKPEPKEEMEEVECANCGYRNWYPKDKYPDKCPQCGIEWR